MTKKEECRTSKFYIIMLLIMAAAIIALPFIVVHAADYIPHTGKTGGTMINITSAEMIDTEKHTQIIINTYAGEQYIAEGKIDVIQSGGEKKEALLELQGSIEKQENTKQEDKKVQKADYPAVLTVYMNEAVYGFYSNYPIELTSPDGMNVIEMYGYLEGYYDGENQYST